MFRGLRLAVYDWHGFRGYYRCLYGACKRGFELTRYRGRAKVFRNYEEYQVIREALEKIPYNKAIYRFKPEVDGTAFDPIGFDITHDVILAVPALEGGVASED